MAGRHRQRWARAVLGGAALLVLAVSGGLQAGADPPAPAIGAVARPCHPPAETGTGACTADPTQLTATWSAPATVASVEVTWVPGAARTAGAPEPSHSSVLLDTSSCTPGSAPGTTVCTWPWPAAMETSGSGGGQSGHFLNGTYQVTACSTPPAGDCAPTPGLAPATVAVAVPPAAPAGVKASVSAPAARIGWTANPEPDLAGYAVQRNGRTVWSCTTPAGGPATCPSPPTFTDHPGGGTFTYAVIAERLGVDGQPAGFVSSAPAAAAPVTVAGNPPTFDISLPPAHVQLPPVPYFGPVPTVPPVQPPGAGPGVTTATTSPTSAFSGSLPYAAPTTGGSLPGSAAPAASREDGPSQPGRNALGALAAAVLVLAVATELWFLRREAVRYHRPRHFRHTPGG